MFEDVCKKFFAVKAIDVMENFDAYNSAALEIAEMFKDIGKSDYKKAKEHAYMAREIINRDINHKWEKSEPSKITDYPCDEV